MASNQLSLHIPHDSTSTPSTMMIVIDELSKSPNNVFNTSKELQEYLMEMRGTPNRSEVVATAKNLGLLIEVSDGIQISKDAMSLVKIRDDARADLLHYLTYTGWSKNTPFRFAASWAYQRVSDEFWKLGSVDITSEYLERQISEIINTAETTFAEFNAEAFDEISFSRQSTRAILNYLEAVNPSVIEDKTRYQRRAFCPPELMMMAIGHVVSQEDNAIGIDILLTPEKREQICKICLLDPDSFDRVLDWTLPIFPHLIAPGTTAGFYGRFIRLHRIPAIQDVIR